MWTYQEEYISFPSLFELKILCKYMWLLSDLFPLKYVNCIELFPQIWQSLNNSLTNFPSIETYDKSLDHLKTGDRDMTTPTSL